MSAIKYVIQFIFNRLIFIFAFRVPLWFKMIIYRYLLSDNRPILKNSKITQPSQFVGRGSIKLSGAFIGVWPSPNLFNGVSYFEARARTARLEVGEGTYINNNSVIIVDKTLVTIGKRCLIGPNFFSTDSDFHGVRIENRLNGVYDCKPVVIENDVFIGEGVRVLKGVTIRNGAVVGSGSLVTKDVAANTLVAGVPARKISDI